MKSRRSAVSEIRVGDSANDPDYRFPAGRVVAVGAGWFEVRWTRGGVTYTKRHGEAVLGAGHLVVW
jgi:uncharacterized protein (DUF736 family)